MRRLAAAFAAFSFLLSIASPVEASPSPLPAPVRGGTKTTTARADEVRAGEAPADAIAAARTQAVGALVDRLNQVAAWCNEKELFVERDRLWRKVIELAPDDPAARKGLRYSRNVDGAWKDPAPREVKNLGKKFLEDLVKREEAAYAPFGDALLALARAPERTAPERDALVAEIRVLAPNHAGLHAWLGDVQLGDRWVMPETATAKERRPAIRAEAKRLMENGAPIATETATDAERALGVTWQTVLQGENVRVLSTGPLEESLRIARACESAGGLLEFALGAPMRYPSSYTVYVLAGPGERETFLAGLPNLPEADRARISALEGTGLPGTTNVALFAPDLARRTDNGVRHTIGNVLTTSLGVSHKTAWAWEGIGQYLTRELVGTRLTWFVSEAASPAAVGLRGKLMTPDSNWIQEAYELLVAGTAPGIEDLMRRELDQLDVAGALTGYALVAYLLEGQPTTVLSFVTRSAKGDDPAAIAREVLKRTPTELQERLVQWLSERR